MTWVFLDDSFPKHPKVLEVGPLAGWLFVASLCYANRFLTDGFISLAAISTLAAFEGILVDSPATLPGIQAHVDPGELVDKLVAAGLWEEADGGYLIHDYEHYQPTKEEVASQRLRWREKKRRQRAGVSDSQKIMSPGESRGGDLKRESRKSRSSRARTRDKTPGELAERWLRADGFRLERDDAEDIVRMMTGGDELAWNRLAPLYDELREKLAAEAAS